MLEIRQPRAQPLEALADIAQVLRPVHLDRVREIGGAHPADRLIELADRARDEHREHDRQRQRDADRREREIEPFLAPLRGRFLQALDRALREFVGGVQRALRALDELRIAVGQRGDRGGRALRGRQQPVQCALALAQLVERLELRLFERQQRELRQRLLELLPHPRVVFEQRRVLEDDFLAREPLERGRLLEQQAARASRPAMPAALPAGSAWTGGRARARVPPAHRPAAGSPAESPAG